MVSLMLEDPKGTKEWLRELIHPIIDPVWIEYVFEPLTIEDHERAAEVLDLLIDILEDSGIGVQRKLVPADEAVECFTPRKLTAPCNNAYFELTVNPEGGLNIQIRLEGMCFIEHGLTPEAVTTLIFSFVNLRLARPRR